MLGVAVASGLDSAVLGLARPVFFCLLVWAALSSPGLSIAGSRSMAAGAGGSAVNSLIFVFVNAGYSPPADLVTYAEVTATLFFGLFTAGFLYEMARLAHFKRPGGGTP